VLTRADGVKVHRIHAQSAFTRVGTRKPRPKQAAVSPSTEAQKADAPRPTSALPVRVARRGGRYLRRLGKKPVARAQRTITRGMTVSIRKLLRPFHLPSLYQTFGNAAADLAVAWGADAFHGHDLNGLYPAIRAAKRRPGPVIYDSHELWVHRNKKLERWERAAEQQLEKRWIAQAAGVITVAPSIATWLQGTYALPETPVVVRNIPVDEGSHASDHLRAETGLSNDAQILLYTGRITTSRGIESSIAALAHLAPHVHLVMLGYGPDNFIEELRQLATSHGVADRLHQVQPVGPHEVVGVAAGADVAIVAIEPICLSYEYSLPNKLFEAIHAGLPVVATRLTELDALINEHGIGTTYPPNDDAQLAASINEILANYDQFAAASRHAATTLTWSREQEHLLDLYRRLA